VVWPGAFSAPRPCSVLHAISDERGRDRSGDSQKGREITLGVLFEKFLAGLLATGDFGTGHREIVIDSLGSRLKLLGVY